MAMGVPFLVSGGSATELSVTGAWLKAADVDWQNLRQFAAAVCIELLTSGPVRGPDHQGRAAAPA